MPNVNKVILIGNLTRDVELRVTPSGTAIGTFGLAVNRKYKGANDQPMEEVLFVDCEAWGKTAEVIAQYVGKGKPLYVDGRLKLDQWEDKTTKEKKSKIKVVVENFQFLGGDRDGGSQQPAIQQSTGRYGAPRSAPATPPAQPQRDVGPGEDVPW